MSEQEMVLVAATFVGCTLGIIGVLLTGKALRTIQLYKQAAAYHMTQVGRLTAIARGEQPTEAARVCRFLAMPVDPEMMADSFKECGVQDLEGAFRIIHVQLDRIADLQLQVSEKDKLIAEAERRYRGLDSSGDEV